MEELEVLVRLIGSLGFFLGLFLLVTKNEEAFPVMMGAVCCALGGILGLLLFLVLWILVAAIKKLSKN